jgi:hypothetical protein
LNDNSKLPTPVRLSEDWLAVIIAFALIALAALGVLGPSGLPIAF